MRLLLTGLFALVGCNLAKVAAGHAASTVPATTTVVKRRCAGIAQLVERNLAKVEVAGSNPVSRSNPQMARWQSGYAADCNSVYAGSIPTRASNQVSVEYCPAGQNRLNAAWEQSSLQTRALNAQTSWGSCCCDASIACSAKVVLQDIAACK